MPKAASKGNKGSKELGSLGHEGEASQQNMGNGSVRKGTGGERAVPWVTLRRTGIIPFRVFPDETGQQLAHGFTVDLIPG